ncbi:MAG TPA: DUF2283 domain-containing protein [Candidatus Baltobacteraceae bacterium]|jgi:uncharacterized protein YuzE|nr:DUF2283 domain-containing protein [Candidatus Baltobacteraceae bacterium]
MTTEGARGPAYLRYAQTLVADTQPSEEDEDVVIDVAADGSVVGVELVSVNSATITALVKVANHLDLDLSLLFSRPITPQAS